MGLATSAVASKPERQPARCESDRWQEWDRFVEAAPDSGFMQTSWWAEFRSMCGYRCFGVTIRDGGAIVGGAMVMKRSFTQDHCFYLICDGPLLPEEPEFAGEVFQSILNVIQRHRASETQTVSHLRIEPRWQRLAPFTSAFRALPRAGDRYTEPRDTLWLDLRPSAEQILAQMKPKGRYNIGLAERHGVRVTEDGSPDGIKDFLRIHDETLERHRLRRRSAGYFRTLLSIFPARRRISIFFAEHEGRRLATALVVFFGRRATYFFGGSLAEQRHLMAPYALHYEVMRRAKQRGCDWYDFWGVSPPGWVGDSWQGISAFKRKFGGMEIHLTPTLDSIYETHAYDVFLHAAST